MSSYTTLTCVVYNECEIIIVFSHCGDSECRGRKKIPRPCTCGARLSEYLVLSSYKLPWSAEISSICDRSNGRKEPTSQRVQPVWEPLPGKNGNLICFVFRRTWARGGHEVLSHVGFFSRSSRLQASVWGFQWKTVLLFYCFTVLFLRSSVSKNI